MTPPAEDPPLGSLAGRRVLVTGGRGFIGTALVERLCREGAEVHTVSRGASAPRAGVRHRRLDLAEAEPTRALLEEARPDIIFHLAGHAFGARDLELVWPTLQSNLVSTVSLLTAAAEVGCQRLVLPASLEEPEGDPGSAVPSSPYAASKWAASAYGRMFHTLFELPVVLARIFVVYGPGQDDLKKLLPYVIGSLLRGEPPELGSGTREIDWVFLDDVVEGLVRLAGVPGIEGRRIDLGSGRAASVRAIVERIAALCGTPDLPRFGARADRPLEQVRVAALEETRQTLGWAPATPLEEGLRRTLAWHRARR